MFKLFYFYVVKILLLQEEIATKTETNLEGVSSKSEDNAMENVDGDVDKVTDENETIKNDQKMSDKSEEEKLKDQVEEKVYFSL